MATRSRIGIVNEDGTVSSIYCHWDGYPEGNGKILLLHYSDRNKVQSLIDLGAISSLRANVLPYDPYNNVENEKVKSILDRFNPTEKHSFENPQPDVTVAFHRDRGEEYIKPRINESLEDYLNADNEEYGYVFTPEGEWLVRPCYGDVAAKPIAEVLAERT